jgi:hypothetical protein
MKICPVCNENSIGFLKVFFSAPLIPIRCDSCRSLVRPSGIVSPLLEMSLYLFLMYFGFLLFLNTDIEHIFYLIAGVAIYGVLKYNYGKLSAIKT